MAYFNPETERDVSQSLFQYLITQFRYFELLQSDHFKISFGSRRCCDVREHVATGCAVREKRPRSGQCRIERFGHVER